MAYDRRHHHDSSDTELGIATVPSKNSNMTSTSRKNGEKFSHDEYELQQTGSVREGETIEAPPSKLHRGLKARHISMIAIGGAIGTGLIIGT